MANPKLKIDVNHNPTKKGVKVQFVFPTNIEGDQKAELTQKLQAKLNGGLSQYGLTVNQDTDVPYSNVIEQSITPIHMTVLGQAQSMGFVIATCGIYRYASKRTTFMYHEIIWSLFDEKMSSHEQELIEALS